MSLRLEDINSNNWIDCIFLTTDKEEKHLLFEEFVASNAVSLAQSKMETGWETKAIYNEDQMVGFAMYGFAEKEGFYEICRFMIDYRFQNKGYGKKALLLIIEEMRNIPDCQEIYLSFDPENKVALYLYENIGFKDTGRTVEGNITEVLYSLELDK
ncbi:GNAT family N-acetyltransferase [Lederbergia sp. NSJ-179]|uniref:GNAT family N-acetyltransferase n=1 Tax=Lederbergia sp. NSJ-179 TaxID=2931402 RepID=UPI001FD2203F|nr:GNAT family N-acetyltransferase [Lederbergia sp. NSJ-179]MCJ7842518.1 GNAT family N-acetyltransferase [Lederbergia sp. NSJ-179]